jgi:ribosomal protein L4
MCKGTTNVGKKDKKRLWEEVGEKKGRSGERVGGKKGWGGEGEGRERVGIGKKKKAVPTLTSWDVPFSLKTPKP